MAKENHLPPETILKIVTETEERVWNQGGISSSSLSNQSTQSTAQDVGCRMLLHGCTGKKIHDYFTNLEQRRCCLLLASCKQRFQSVRLVRNDGRDSGIEEGAMMKNNLDNTETVTALNAVQFQVFQQALKCAAFPVLGAPEPPSGASPIQSPSLLAQKRLTTPPSLNDSGVEEQDDTAMIPAETLCELLRRAFKLSPEKFRQYEGIVATQMEKKSAQKVLAEELVRQLVALENNNNPYYNPKTFCNKLAYDQWQKKERSHITDLLNKFWHFSLPQSSKSRQTVPEHEQYKFLMQKLIQYESPYRQQNELIAPAPTTPLSSASVCLLKEFGLRYGVGEQYRKIVYLEYLALNFDPTVWFIQHVASSLTSVIEVMPSKRSYLMIVRDELSLFENALSLLEAKSITAIKKMKTLFSTNRPLDGVEALIDLLALILQSKSYLMMKSEESLDFKLSEAVQDIFPATYERHKLVALDELRQSKWQTELSPNLLNMLIGNIRDEVLDYKNNYQIAFIKYFNITVEAAQVFYKLLMRDVALLCSQQNDSIDTMEIDLLMLSLGYRLNQLDHDWSTYISHQMQTWRELFLLQAQHWTVVVKVHMQDFVVQSMSTDKFQHCDLSTTGISGNFSQSQPLLRQRAPTKSLTPSANSAFSSPSSAFSTPLNHGASQPRSMPQMQSKLVEPKQVFHPNVTTQQGRLVFPIEESPTIDLSSPRRPTSDPVNISHSAVLNGTYLGAMARSLGHYDDDFLTFTNVRHSSSLPDIHSQEKYIEMRDQSRKQSDNDNAQRNKHDNTKGPDNSNRLKINSDNSDNFKTVSVNENDIRSDNDKRFKVRRPSMVSQELTNYLPIEKVSPENDNDSDESGTLTDETGSQNGEEFSFPPLEEIKSGTPVYNNNDKAHFEKKDGGREDIVRPVVMKSKVISPNKYLLSSQRSQTKQEKDISDQLQNDSFNLDDRVRSYAYDNTSLGEANLYGGPDSFTDSITSNVSFPQIRIPENLNTELPVSSSSIDVVVILQRIVGFSRTLTRMLAPVTEEHDSENSFISSGGSRDYTGHVQYKYCQKLYDSFLSAISNTIRQLADNMLSMDLCGTSNRTANRLAGPRLVEYLQTQQRSRLIWGCRHDVSGTGNCFEYLNRQTPLLCDRHEPITRDMCKRINNVSTMLACLEWYHRYLVNTLGIISDLTVHQHRHNLQMSVQSLDMLKNEFIMLENYGYDPRKDRSEVMETGSQLCPSIKSETGSNILVTSPVDPDKDHLMAIVRAQCRIMAYRINLFVCDALPVLLTLKSPSAPLDVGLKPVTDFLSVYISALKNWLYNSTYRRVLECLWIFIVQDFELELNKLEKSEKDTQNTGQQLLQALSHLLKFMNNQEGNLRKELLLAQAEDVSFRLSLYAMPISQLIAIHRGLVKESAGSEVSSTNTLYQTVIMVRQKLKQDLQTLRKCFSGDELVQWIMENQECNMDLLLHFHPDMADSHITRETAHHIAQRFLDWGLIADLEEDHEIRRGDSPSSLMGSYEFPDMTILAQMKGERPFSRISEDDHTPQATPRATPRPNLKTSIRAISSMSGVKPLTPGMRVMERSQSSQFSRSQRFDPSSGVWKKVNKQNINVEDHSINTDSSSISEHTEEIIIEQETVGRRSEVTKGHRRERSRGQRSESSDTVTPPPAGSPSTFEGQGTRPSQNSSTESENREFEFSINKPGLKESMNVNASNNYDPYFGRGTPISMTSAMSSESRTTYFFDTMNTFYYVCPQVGNEADFGHKNHELFQLVEQCFQGKITPEYIVKIIYSRRKQDPKAREFIRKCPSHLVERIKYEIHHEEVSTCVSS